MLTDQLSTPIGVLGIGATELGLAPVRFGGPVRIGMADGCESTADGRDGTADGPARLHLAAAVQQLEEYFAGQRTAFTLTLDWSGVSGLRLAVLQLLQSTVPFGRSTTYGELASRASAPTAAQAVGAIMGSNPLPIVVPCHRVLAADGLGGFGGGLRTKEWLLAWEGLLPAPLDLECR